MTTVVEPTFRRNIISPLLSRLHEFASGDWIVPAGTTKLSDEAALHTQLTAGPYDGFAYSNTSSSGLTARFGTGEAFVGGRFLASDDATMTDDATTELVHAVDLPASQTTTVYLGPDDRTNNAATDRLIIGRDDSGVSHFPSDTTPKTELYNLTTDVDSITAIEDLRTTTQQISANATSANNATSLSGQPPSSWARTDTTETFDRAVGIGNGSPHNPVGSATDERLRIFDELTATSSTDTILQSATGAARMSVAYNSYYDGTNWRVNNGSENASVIGMNSGNPGLSSGAIITFGGFSVLDDASTGEGDSFDWEWIGTDRGRWYANGEAMASIPSRSTAPPASAVPRGSAGMWVDPTAQTVNFILGDGRTASINLDTLF